MEREAEFLQLAREAGAALEAGPSWVEVAQLLINGLAVIALMVGVVWMQAYGKQREREVDAMAARLRETNREVEEALDRQGQALDRQGEVFAELLHAPKAGR